MLIFKIQNLDGFESWLYFGSKYGCNSYILLYNYACFSFSNKFCVTYGIVCKDSRFGNKLFDIHVHKIGGCYVLKVNLFIAKRFFLITYF
jgi:hypothetical protein